VDPAGRDPAINPDPDRLTGWKEIGAYLDKGVRTVQRWEKEYRLPVNRLGRPGGEIIWASRRELDAWLKAQGPAARAADAERGVVASSDNNGASPKPALPPDLAATPPPKPAPEAPAPARRWRRAPWIAFGVVSTVALIWVSLSFPRTPPRQPVSWEVKAGQLTVFDRSDQPIFSKAFPYVADGMYNTRVENQPGGRVAFADLDGDGSNEVLFAAASSSFPVGMGVFAYDADGTERFVVRPTHQVTFGSGTYAGPWLPYHLFVIGEGEALSIFAVFIGSLEYPTLLIELDGRGRVRSEYWSNGYIQAVVRAPWRGHEALFVGATNNDTRGASLAIFADGHATGSAPSAQQAYRCLSCAPGIPTEFLVFPRRALAKAFPGGDQQATVAGIKIEQDGKIRVSVGEGSLNVNGTFSSTVWYTLDASLAPTEALLTSGLFAEHARALAEGLVKLPFGKADEDALFPVRRWTSGGFVDLPRGRVAR
jgi:hypothetical protein